MSLRGCLKKFRGHVTENPVKKIMFMNNSGYFGGEVRDD
jgi:hypothetical protein